MNRAFLVLVLLASPAVAETVVAARTIPPQTVIAIEDLMVHDSVVPGGLSDPRGLVGMEARVALFQGRPIRTADVGFPAIVERNQNVQMIYRAGGMLIATEGRALGRAGPGDTIRVMNIASRNTVNARIGVDGAAYVSQ